MKKVLIITLSVIVVLIILFYFYNVLNFYDPTEIAECSVRDISIILENYTCVSGEDGFLEFQIKNGGKKEPDSLSFRVHDRPEAEFGVYPLVVNQSDDMKYFYHYDFPITVPVDELLISDLVLLEIGAGILDARGDFKCKSYLVEKINCI